MAFRPSRYSIFLSTPSARRATDGVQRLVDIEQFLSTPSARRATDSNVDQLARENEISIHALREEGDRQSQGQWQHDPPISIHALREEGDLRRLVRRTRPHISIHALREEGDLRVS